MKSCSFLHAHFFELMEVVENFCLKKASSEKFIHEKVHIEIAS